MHNDTQNTQDLFDTYGVKLRQLASCELDIVNEENTDAAEELAAKHNVLFRLLIENGPGGGWPVYEFVGEVDDIGRLIADYDGQAYA